MTRSWTVPADAVSGVYIAHLVNNNDPDIESHITFVVRDDDSDSDVVLQTSDETWQAYNRYGGNSLYACDTVCPAGEPLGYKAAYKVSYNRPLRVEEDSPPSALFRGAEYSMIRFLEANGYDMSYVSGVDTHARGQVLQNHRLFISSGHDEYWSGPQRTNVENARDAGVNLAFFAGNLMFWKTRFESEHRRRQPGQPHARLLQGHPLPRPAGPGVLDRHVARLAIHQPGRQRHAGERGDRHVVPRQLRHVPAHGAVRVPQHAPVA